MAARYRHLHDGGWIGEAADAFHTYRQRQAARHTTTADATRSAAHALTELADGIEARPHLRRPGRRPLRRQRRRATPVTAAPTRSCANKPATCSTPPEPTSTTCTPASGTDSPPPASCPIRAVSSPTRPGEPGHTRQLAHPARHCPAPTPQARIGPQPRSDRLPRVRLDSVDATGTADFAAAATALRRDRPWRGRPARRVVVRRGDTLSAIAARYLGDAGRWPEILDRNPTIAHPWQIHPGQTLTLPDNTDPAGPAGPPGQPGPSSRSRTGPTDHTADGAGDGSGSGHPAAAPSPAPTVEQPPDMHDGSGGDQDTDPADGRRHDHDPGGVGLESGLLIGGGLAAALSAAFLLRQRRHARTYRPGTPDLHRPAETDQPTDPVSPVSAPRPASTAPQTWRRSCGSCTTPTTAAPDPMGSPSSPAQQPHRPPRHWLLPSDDSRTNTARRGRPRLLVPFGLTAAGASVPIDLTSTPALVLTPTTTAAVAGSVVRSGDRAEDVARAMLLTIAAGLRTLTGGPLGHVVITSADLRHLLGLNHPGPRRVALPGTIRVVDDLDAALDELEVALAHRAPFPGRTTRSRPPSC